MNLLVQIWDFAEFPALRLQNTMYSIALLREIQETAINVC